MHNALKIGVDLLFKKMKSLNMPYNKQGLIYFTCIDFKNQPRITQEKIVGLCSYVGGKYYDALFDMVTSGKSPVEISIKYYISEATVYRLKRKFYREWDKEF